jgi:hypothetical protein
MNKTVALYVAVLWTAALPLRVHSVVAPVFSLTRSVAATPGVLTLSSPTAGAQIRYTVDGRAPTPSNGSVYSGPFWITNNICIRALACVSGEPPSEVVSHTFLFPAQTLQQTRGSFPASWGPLALADYDMDPDIVTDPRYRATLTNDLLTVPTLSVACAPEDLFSTNGIYYNTNTMVRGDYWERAASVELFDATHSSDMQVDCGVQISGGASREPAQSAKHSFSLVFKKRFGPGTLKYRFFPDTQLDTFDDIVLRAGFNDSWTARSANLHLPGQYLRDRFVRSLQRSMGVDCGSSRFVHLYLDGLYWGLYDSTSKPDAQYAGHRFGGDETDYDSIFPINGPAQVDLESGTWDAFTSMFAIVNAGTITTARYAALQQYLDLPRFADYMLLNHWAMNADWPRGNWRLLRERTRAGKFIYHCWDSEWTLSTQMPNWWNTERGDLRYVINGLGSNNDPTFAWCPGRVFWRLFNNAEFRLLYADRLQRWCFNGGPLYVDPAAPGWNPSQPERNRPAARYAAMADEIDRAIVAESARWGDNVSWRTTQPYTRDDDWVPQRDWMLQNLLSNRTAQFLNICRGTGLYPRIAAPIFAPQHGGLITPGWQLSITNPSPLGTVYYTRDGSDPRTAFTGAVAPGALVGTGMPIALAQSTIVKARILTTGTWSALTEAIFWCTNDNAAIRVTEVMYNPRGGGDYEFIELKNCSSNILPIAGLQFDEGIYATVPEGVYLPPGGFYVMITHRPLFDARYPNAPAGERYLGKLDNAGERITLRDAYGNVIESFRYESSWYPLTDGTGYSLVRRVPYGDPNESNAWRASTFEDGSPGADDPDVDAGSIVINEVLAHAAPPLETAIELYNTTTTNINLGGWYLSDNAGDLQRYHIAANTLAPATGFVMLYEYQFSGGTDMAARIALSPSGGVVCLTSPEMTPLYHVVQQYGPSEKGVSLGRYRRGDGSVVFVALSNITFGSGVGPDDPAALSNVFRTGMGAPNAPPKVGPIVVSEFMYHPGPGAYEFIELANIGPTNVVLGGPISAPWRLEDDTATMYVCPTGTVLQPSSWAVIVGKDVNPAMFRALYNIDPTIPVLGPCVRALGNSGDAIRLFKPLLLPDGSNIVDMLVEEIEYSDRAPWPTEADGGGPSLERVELTAFANDVQNWQLGRNGGSPGGIPEPAVWLWTAVCFMARGFLKTINV